jgi:hypothetical protein
MSGRYRRKHQLARRSFVRALLRAIQLEDLDSFGRLVAHSFSGKELKWASDSNSAQTNFKP